MEHRVLEVVELQKNGKEYILTTSYNGKEFTHPIEIVNNTNGVKGISMPDELTCILQNEYTNVEVGNFITKVFEKFTELNAPVV